MMRTPWTALPLAMLSLAFGLGMGDDTDLARLVGQLGSEVKEVREQASAALEAVGEDAVPVLRVALDSRDRQVREQAAKLLEKIEARAFLPPTEVRLAFEDCPLPRVLEEINRQAGTKLQIYPERNSVLSRRMITLKDPEPVTFWKAFDRLCEVGKLHVNPSIPRSSESAVDEFWLVDGALEPGFVSYHGSIRMKLVTIEMARKRDLDRPVGRPETPVGRFFVRLEILAEPRLMLGTDQMPWLTKATDDLGHSLVTEGRGTSGLPFGPASANQSTQPIEMQYPEQPGQKIERMEGIAPVILAIREEVPVTINLDDAQGKTFQHAGIELEVLGVHVDPEGQSPHVVDVVLRPIEEKTGQEASGSTRFPILSGSRQWELDKNQFELIDAEGNVIPWIPTTTQPLPHNALRTSLRPVGNESRPVALRYYGLRWSRVEVPFRFESVPMP